MFYLQKVIACIKNEKCVPELKRLGCVLKEAGIRFQCLMGEHITNCSFQMNTGQSDLEGEMSVMSEASGISCLWITDCADWASFLKMQNKAVLALLHADNRNRDFSGISYACENVGDLDADYMEGVYRRYVNLPWDIAKTDRCVIRETTEEDVKAFWEIYSYPDITRYTEGLYPTIEKEEEYIREYIEKVYGFYGFGIWTIMEKDTGEIIGRAGFSYREGYEEPEIGFVIGVPWQRQGYAYEVCSAMLEYGKAELGFEVVNAFVIPENKASLALCEKLSMKVKGEVFINGQKHMQLQKTM